MTHAELPSPGDDLQRFVGFVEHAQKSIPRSVPCSLVLPTFDAEIEDKTHLTEVVGEVWDDYAKDYVRQESVEAHAVTMKMLLDTLKTPQTGERWLSLGSGPGLYELFLAMRHPGLNITSLDISKAFINMQRERLFNASLRTPRLKSQIQPMKGSMNNLEAVGSDFDAILSINSLQWSTDWRGVVDQTDKALSPKVGSRIYSVIGSVKNSDGSMSGTIGAGLVADYLVDEYENRGFYTTILGELSAVNGQFGRPMSRNFAVFERREGEFAPWEERIDGDELPFVHYAFRDGAIHILEK